MCSSDLFPSHDSLEFGKGYNPKKVSLRKPPPNAEKKYHDHGQAYTTLTNVSTAGIFADVAYGSLVGLYSITSISHITSQSACASVQFAIGDKIPVLVKEGIA